MSGQTATDNSLEAGMQRWYDDNFARGMDPKVEYMDARAVPTELYTALDVLHRQSHLARIKYLTAAGNPKERNPKRVELDTYCVYTGAFMLDKLPGVTVARKLRTEAIRERNIIELAASDAVFWREFGLSGSTVRTRFAILGKAELELIRGLRLDLGTTAATICTLAMIAALCTSRKWLRAGEGFEWIGDALDLAYFEFNEWLQFRTTKALRRKALRDWEMEDGDEDDVVPMDGAVMDTNP